jgi:hypothetical protein
MGDLYYSQRQRRLRDAPESHIGRDFLAAFTAYLNRISDDGYLCKHFGEYWCQYGICGRDDQKMANRLTEDIGPATWPPSADASFQTDQVLDILEFLYRYVAKPTGGSVCNSCGRLHPERYDVRQGRYEYTIEINRMLARFHHPYELRKGRAVRKGSDVLDAMVGAVEFRTEDHHLLKLLDSARTSFHDRSGKRKLEGLRSIVDAFERVKTLHGGDKKTSVKAVVGQLSPVEEVQACFDEHLRKLTDLANRYTIRHHERGKTELDDEALIEYLFYSYYNLVRFILEKHGLARDSSSEQEVEE